MQRGSILTLAKLEGERKLWHHGLPEDGVDALASPLSVIFNLAIGQQNVIPAKWKKAKVTPPWYAVKAFRGLRTIFSGRKQFMCIDSQSSAWRACRYFWSAARVHPRTSVVHCIDQWPTTLCRTQYYCVEHSIISWWFNCTHFKQGWTGCTRPPQMWPGFESWCRRHMWVEIVVGFLQSFASRAFFSCTSVFPSP